MDRTFEGRGLAMLLLAALAGACGDEGTRSRALAETVARDVGRDCESAAAPDAVARRNLHRLCGCTRAKIAASAIRFGESDSSIGRKVRAATEACRAETGGPPGGALTAFPRP